VVQNNLGAQNSSMIRAMEGSSIGGSSNNGNIALAQVRCATVCDLLHVHQLAVVQPRSWFSLASSGLYELSF
jgi:hypothetical protein